MSEHLILTDEMMVGFNLEPLSDLRSKNTYVYILICSKASTVNLNSERINILIILFTLFYFIYVIIVIV